MKKVVLGVLVTSMLTGCVTREVIRTVEVPVNNTPIQGSTITIKNCDFTMKFGDATPTEAGHVKLLQRTDGTYIQLMNGNVMPVEKQQYNAKFNQTLFFVSTPDEKGKLILGMASNCM